MNDNDNLREIIRQETCKHYDWFNGDYTTGWFIRYSPVSEEKWKECYCKKCNKIFKNLDKSK